MTLGYVLAEARARRRPSQLLPAREQMAFTLMVHVILVPFGVALPFITLVMNYLGLRRGDQVAMQLARRWSTVMAIQFAVGAVTGTVISLEFGLLWPGMMGKWGDVIGIAFGIEGWAFFLEAILIAIYIYGWKRMSPRAHFLVGLPLPIIGLVGAFSILSVNAWMNTPQGFTLDSQGNPTNVDISQVVFTPILATAVPAHDLRRLHGRRLPRLQRLRRRLAARHDGTATTGSASWCRSRSPRS